MYTLENMRSSSHANSYESLTLLRSLKTCSQDSRYEFLLYAPAGAIYIGEQVNNPYVDRSY